ncbi:hypothetical protein MMC31_007467, partial [Peltigera leucophlebia]|nr:hypothetical protein [Peltigera leucophlebia]
MAAATIKHGAHRIFGGHHRSLAKSDPVDVEQREKEKQVITDFLDQRDGNGGGVGESRTSLERVGTLDQRLGLSSRQLGIKDFKLLKTIGTGRFYPLPPSSEKMVKMEGTFARVWLSSLAGSNSEKDKGKVFALKILRKAD